MAKDSRSGKKQDWRKAVRKAMYEASVQEAVRRYDTPEPRFNYRWEHVTAVVTLACKLARLMEADIEVVEAAAWLHDVCKEKGHKHPQEGAKFARKLLPQTNFPPDKIDQVAQVIKDHMGLWRGDPWPEAPLTNLESMVLWDADKLTKIGLTSAFHWTGFALARQKPHNTRDFIQNGREQDWQHKTVASMHTEPARRAAKKRFKAYQQLWHKLEKELNGDDLQKK